jgi:hypothetical protein
VHQSQSPFEIGQIKSLKGRVGVACLEADEGGRDALLDQGIAIAAEEFPNRVLNRDVGFIGDVRDVPERILGVIGAAYLSTSVSRWLISDVYNPGVNCRRRCRQRFTIFEERFEIEVNRISQEFGNLVWSIAGGDADRQIRHISRKVVTGGFNYDRISSHPGVPSLHPACFWILFHVPDERS